MVEIDFAGVVKVLKECSKLVRATRGLLGSVGVIVPHMGDLELELRARAAEVQAYKDCLDQEAKGPAVG